MVTHPSTNRAQCRLTTLIDAPIHYAATKVKCLTNVNSERYVTLICTPCYKKTKPPNVGVGFSVIHVSQGSVATYVRCGGRSTQHYISNFLLSPLVKNFYNRLRSDKVTGKVWGLRFLEHAVCIQTEIASKLDFIWRRKFGVEKENVETMASVNKVLLENILPAHVADYFLSSPHRQEVRT